MSSDDVSGVAPDSVHELSEKHARRYRAVVENAPDCIHLIDLDGRVTNMNRAGLRMLGLPKAADIEGTKLLEFVAPEDRARVASVLKRACRGNVCHVEFTATTRRGRRRFEKNLAPLFDERGNVTELVAITQDVTTQRRMENRERAAQERFRSMVENLPAGAVYRTGNVLFMNRTAERLTGYPRDELDTIGAWFGRLYGDRAVSVRSRYEADRQRGFPAPRTAPFRRKDGENRLMRVYACRDESAEVWLLHDVTEEQRVQKQVGELAAILDSSDDAIFQRSLDGVIESWNDGAERIFGYSGREMLGRDVSLIVPAGREDEWGRLFSRVIAGERVEHFETVRRRKDGSDISVSLIIWPVLDKQGCVVGAVTIARDITDRKRKESALRLSEQRLRELAARLLVVQEEERRRVSRELHDDLGQRLTLLRMQVDALAEPTPSPSSNQETHKGVETLRELVEALAGRIRDLPHRLHPSAVEHLGLIVALQKECDSIDRIASSAVSFHVDENVPRQLPLNVAMCLYRIAQEAIGNAVKHSGGDHIEVSLESVDGGVRLSVEDNGGGFDVNDVRPDCGLGLVSMEERARVVRGRFELESMDGIGTRVRCWTPSPNGSHLD